MLAEKSYFWARKPILRFRWVVKESKNMQRIMVEIGGEEHSYHRMQKMEILQKSVLWISKIFPTPEMLH